MREDKIKQARLLRSAFREMMKGVYTSIPGHILTFDPETQLAQVQIGIQRVDLDGATFNVKPIIETPVLFNGDGATLEFKIEPGCEGWITFSQRCIDGWLQSGGIAANPLGRFHDMQDAMFIPGARPVPRAITNFANDGIRIRNKDGDVFVWVKDDKTVAIENGAAIFNMLPTGEVIINGLTITPDGNLITAAGVNLNLHGHLNIANTAPATGKPIT